MRLRSHLLMQAFCGALVILTLGGCNFMAVPLLFAHVMGVGDKANIQYTFPKDARRVAIVVNQTRHNQVDVGHFDRDVNNYLAPKVFDYVKGSQEIVRATKVHKWIDEHPDWKTPFEIGRGLEADHIVFVEMRNVTFYEKEGWKNMYKGQVECNVTVYRIGTDADEAEPIWGPKNYTFVFPRGLEPIASSDVPVAQFREALVRHVATRLSWIFVPHADNEEYGDKD